MVNLQKMYLGDSSWVNIMRLNLYSKAVGIPNNVLS